MIGVGKRNPLNRCCVTLHFFVSVMWVGEWADPLLDAKKNNPPACMRRVIMKMELEMEGTGEARRRGGINVAGNPNFYANLTT